jgi:hypothetical protein
LKYANHASSVMGAECWTAFRTCAVNLQDVLLRLDPAI